MPFSLKIDIYWCFNPRTREGCDFFAQFFLPPLLSFNPRTREGCDIPSCKATGRIIVSIHAPARGATPSLCTL